MGSIRPKGAFKLARGHGDRFSNTGFVSIPNLRKFTELSDEDMNAQLISDELLKWFAQSSK